MIIVVRRAVVLMVLMIAIGVRAQEGRFNPIGAVEAFWLPDTACAAGLGWDRIIFDWAQHQPTGADDWNTLNVDDRWLDAARNCDREVVAIVKHTPAWATDGAVNAGVPRGLDLPIDDPGNLWAGFMRRAAAYYAPRGVSRFIVWNEPDIPAGTYGFIFEGDLNQYARLLKVAALAARQGNPDVRIHIAGTTYWHDVNAGRALYVDRLLEVIAADPDAPAHGYYFDALSVHVYFRTDTVYDIVLANRAALDAHGMSDKAVWIVETNASPNLDPAWRVERPNWQITLEGQSAFLVQAAASGFAAGAERIAAYKLFDWNLAPGAESFGLIRADETHRPAFDTWTRLAALASQWDTARASLARTATSVAVRLPHSDGRETIIAWARAADPVQVRITSSAGFATMGDAFGSAGQMAARNGAFTVALPGAICNPIDGCPVGGQPLIVTLPSLADAIEMP
ncbi:MAG: hypothetical protein SGJ24_07770 [Chloroflexota bacterium]|nr:hypothetical protein [Chloroflexota bacterium]